MEKRLTEEQFKKIIKAHESTLGTPDYTKYTMSLEYKYKKNGKWTTYKFLTWTIPMTGDPNNYYFKTVNDKLYIMYKFPYTDGVYRYEVNSNIKELLGI